MEHNTYQGINGLNIRLNFFSFVYTLNPFDKVRFPGLRNASRDERMSSSGARSVSLVE